MYEFLAWQLEVRHCSPNTLRTYRGRLSAFHDWLVLEGLHTLEVTPEQIESWVKRPRFGRALGEAGKPATQQAEGAVLKSFYKWAQARGHVEHNPAELIGRPKVHNVNPRPIPDHDWRKLWEADLDPTLRLCLGLGYFAGLRRYEILQLEVRHVDSLARRFLGFTRKGGGDDILPYGDCADVLARLSTGADDFLNLVSTAAEGPPDRRLVPWVDREVDGNTGNVINRNMRKATDALWLPRYTPHQLRHSFVTNLLRCGVPLHLVQKLANHSSPTVTSRYIKAGGEELREWMEGR